MLPQCAHMPYLGPAHPLQGATLETDFSDLRQSLQVMSCIYDCAFCCALRLSTQLELINLRLSYKNHIAQIIRLVVCHHIHHSTTNHAQKTQGISKVKARGPIPSTTVLE